MTLPVNIIKRIKEKEAIANQWANSIFEDIKDLSNDGVGDAGEEIVNELVKDHFEDVIFDGTENINQVDGVYDIKINGKRIEIKTATLGVSNNFQHENLYASDKCDLVLFVSICPNNIYFSILDMSTAVMNEKHPKFGIKATLRNNQDDKFKFTFGLNSLKSKYIQNGLSIEYKNNNINEVITFLNEYL